MVELLKSQFKHRQERLSTESTRVKKLLWCERCVWADLKKRKPAGGSRRSNSRVSVVLERVSVKVGETARGDHGPRA